MIVTSSPHLCLSSYPLKGRDGLGDNSKSWYLWCIIDDSINDIYQDQNGEDEKEQDDLRHIFRHTFCFKTMLVRKCWCQVSANSHFWTALLMTDYWLLIINYLLSITEYWLLIISGISASATHSPLWTAQGNEGERGELRCQIVAKIKKREKLNSPDYYGFSVKSSAEKAETIKSHKNQLILGSKTKDQGSLWSRLVMWNE